jgi:hypothetical protein
MILYQRAWNVPIVPGSAGIASDVAIVSPYRERTHDQLIKRGRMIPIIVLFTSIGVIKTVEGRSDRVQ